MSAVSHANVIEVRLPARSAVLAAVEHVFTFAVKCLVTVLIAWFASLWLTSQALAQPYIGGRTPVINTPIGAVQANARGGSFWTRFVTSIKGVPIGARVGRSRNGNIKWSILSGIPGIGGVVSVGNARGVGFGVGEGGYWDDAGIMEDAACRVLALPEGSFGALVMIVSGVIAVVASAMASYRVAMAVLVVGVGSWIIYPVVTLFFGELCLF